MPKISLYNSQRDLPLSIPLLRKAVSFLLDELKVVTDEVIFNFISEEKICEIHGEFFNDASSTDCITFPIDPPEVKKKIHILGEAFICPKVALEYAKKNKINPYEELSRYIVHCLLHLIGYEDSESSKRLKMKRKENLCLKKLLLYFPGLLSQKNFQTK